MCNAPLRREQTWMPDAEAKTLEAESSDSSFEQRASKASSSRSRRSGGRGPAYRRTSSTCSSFLESSSERIPAVSEAGAAGCRSALRTQLLPRAPPRFTATSESHLPASPLGGRCASKHAPPPEKKWRSSTGNWKDVEVVTTVLIVTSDGDATGHGIGNSSAYEVILRTVTKIAARISIATSSSSNSSKIRQQQQQW